MKTLPARTRARAAVAALCAMAAIAAAASTALAPAAAAGARPAARAAAPAVPVVIDCTQHAQIRPGQYILACADGNALLAGLRWSAWGPSSALASGVSSFNDCVPSCVAGHFHSFPALAVLWRAEPRPGHAGQRYFTRLTIIYTGLRAYRAGGQVHHLPVTVTDPLSAAGGA